MRKLRVGLSTCPNDTFAFHALLTGVVPPPPGLALEFELADVEELNRRMLAGELDVAKASFHAMLAMSARVVVLPVGSALGAGVGPVLLAGRGRARELPLDPRARVLAPGAYTTATLLYRLLHGTPPAPEQTVFSAILPALEAGRADYGVCIHEARFTFAAHGLELVADLGNLWAEREDALLPLGGLCAARELGAETVQALTRAVRASLEWAHAHRAACLPTLRRHAQESSDEVLWAHVDTYVNEHTLDLGSGGRHALAVLSRCAREQGLVPPDAPPLEIA